MSHLRNNEPLPAIDAVVAWVDGSDPTHAERRALAERRRRFNVNAIPGGRSPTRFSDTGELRLCLRSIAKFCPWIRTIHLVTDGQMPTFLGDPPFDTMGIRLVDHTELFHGYEWALPTFNSRTIESAIHRIKSLAERYVYFNDDVIVLAPTAIDEFFDGDRVVLRGRFAPLPDVGPARILLSALGNHFYDKILRKPRSMAVLAQYRAARLGGAKGRLLLAPHVPHPLRKRTLADYFAANPGVFEANIAHRFRDMRQFTPIPLSNQLELGRGHAVVRADDDSVLLCFNRDPDDRLRANLRKLEGGNARFACLQGLENAKLEFRRPLMEFLESALA